MTKQIEVIASVQRRRRWPRAEKERIVAAAMAPGVVASEVARAAGIHVSQLFRWRQQHCNRGAEPSCAAVTVGVEPSSGCSPSKVSEILNSARPAPRRAAPKLEPSRTRRATLLLQI